MTWGLATITMTHKKMEKLMQSLYYRVIPLLGINRNIAKGWRMLPERFHGLGLPNFVINFLTEKLHVMYYHFGFERTVGEMMTQACEAFLIEVGLYSNMQYFLAGF